MRRVYLALLRLYPADHREIFGPEMLDTFDQAAADVRERGLTAFFWFTTNELMGLLRGLIKERIAQWTGRNPYLTDEHQVDPVNSTEMETRLRWLITRMEFAIANHDFPKARFYSDQERITRAQLGRAIRSSGDDTMSSSRP